MLQSAPDGIKWTDRAVVDGANGFVSTEFDPPVLTQWVRVAWRFSMGVFTWVWQGLVDKIEVPELRNTNGICNIPSHHTPHHPPKHTSRIESEESHPACAYRCHRCHRCHRCGARCFAERRAASGSSPSTAMTPTAPRPPRPRPPPPAPDRSPPRRPQRKAPPEA